MHWELHPTERPAHSQIPWFWVPEKEIFPQLIHIATASELVSKLRELANESLNAMSQARCCYLCCCGDNVISAELLTTIHSGVCYSMLCSKEGIVLSCGHEAYVRLRLQNENDTL